MTDRQPIRANCKPRGATTSSVLSARKPVEICHQPVSERLKSRSFYLLNGYGSILPSGLTEPNNNRENSLANDGGTRGTWGFDPQPTDKFMSNDLRPSNSNQATFIANNHSMPSHAVPPPLVLTVAVFFGCRCVEPPAKT